MDDRSKWKIEFEARIRRYVVRTVRVLCMLPKDVVIKEIVRQVIRSGSSIGANYFEAKSASSKKDFINHFNHSLKSANESKFWYGILISSDMVPSDLRGECDCLLRETSELASIFASSILTMKGRK